MKVLVLSNMYPSPCNPAYGSFVRDQVHALAEQGVECVVVASDESHRAFLSVITKYVGLLLRAFASILHNKFDIVHAHYAFPTGAIGYIVSLMCSAALVITVHGGDIHYARPGIRPLLAFVLRRADRVIPVSKSLYDELSENFGVRTDRMSIVDMGVDTKLFHSIPQELARQKLGLSQSAIILTCVGNLIWRKGIHILLQSVAEISSLYDNLRLILVGDGEQAKQFKRMAEDFGIQGKVLFVGAVPKTEVPMWLSSANCVVHPALEEPFGLVVIEAMSCGKLVIASAVGGIPFFVRDEENGFLVEPGNVQFLAQKIKYVLTFPQEEMDNLRNAAITTAREHDIRVQASKVQTIYRQIRAN